MRAVTSATAAAVLGIDRRALDSLLARIGGDILPAGRQGVERRIPVATLGELLLTLDLISDLQLPARQALLLARSGLSGRTSLGGFLRLAVDLDSLQDEVERRLGLAIESVVRPRRGRPRKRRDSEDGKAERPEPMAPGAL